MIKNTRKVAVLLATYNSQQFISEQIESLFCQTYKDWTLYVCDDGSSDMTVPIINRFAENYPDKIVTIDNGLKSQGAYHNFYGLMTAVSSTYYMFCDHDDVWLPNKIELSVQKMESLEKLQSSEIPIIVHTDMKVVDQQLNEICKSFWKYMRLMPKHNKYRELLACNNVNGCAMIFNQEAKDCACLNYNYCLMHDALLAQSVSASNGIIEMIETPTVLYRQHNNNVIGASKINIASYTKKLKNCKDLLVSNLNVWRRSRHIKRISFASFIVTKIYINILRLLVF